MLVPREQGFNQLPLQQGMTQFAPPQQGFSQPIQQPQQGMSQFGYLQPLPQQGIGQLGFIQQPLQGFFQPPQQPQQEMFQFEYAQQLPLQGNSQLGYFQQPQQLMQPFQQPQQGMSQFGYPQQQLPEQGLAQLGYFQQPQQGFSQPGQQPQQLMPFGQLGFFQQPQPGFGQQAQLGFPQRIAQPQQGMAQAGYPQQTRQEFGGGRQAAGQFASNYEMYQQQAGRPEADLPRDRSGPKNYARSDERIRELICERIIQDLSIDASDVSVEVRSGRVALDGTVPHRQMRHAIEDVVDRCWGVQDIENNIRVQSGQGLGAETGSFGQESRPAPQSGGGFTSTSSAGGSKNISNAGVEGKGKSKDELRPG